MCVLVCFVLCSSRLHISNASVAANQLNCMTWSYYLSSNLKQPFMPLIKMCDDDATTTYKHRHTLIRVWTHWKAGRVKECIWMGKSLFISLALIYDHDDNNRLIQLIFTWHLNNLWACWRFVYNSIISSLWAYRTIYQPFLIIYYCVFVVANVVSNKIINVLFFYLQNVLNKQAHHKTKFSN